MTKYFARDAEAADGVEYGFLHKHTDEIEQIFKETETQYEPFTLGQYVMSMMISEKDDAWFLPMLKLKGFVYLPQPEVSEEDAVKEGS